MLHPKKGVGEHQKPRKTRKGPQIITATLLFCYPVLCAQAQTAQASTSSFYKPQTAQSSSYDKTQQLPQQRTTPNLIQSLLGQTPNQGGMKFPSVFSFQSEQEYNDAIAKATQKLASAKSQLTKATTHLNTAQASKVASQKALDVAQDKLDTATANLDSADDALQSAQDAVDSAQADLDQAKADLDTATQTMKESDASLIQQTQIKQSAEVALQTAQANLNTATSNLQTAQNQQTSAQSNLTAKQSAYAQAQQATAQALLNLQAAQSAYNNSQVPNPAYVAPSYTVQPTSYQIPDNNFTTGADWTGDGSGAGQPAIHSGHLHYSYTGTEVYQDILLYPRQIANYNFTVNVYNQDQNTIGYTGLTPDTYGLRIYFYDENNNLIHQDSLTSNEVHSWRDVTLQGNTNTATPVAKVRIAVYGQDNGFWQGTYGPAMNNVRLTLGWVTGTTQAATTTGTMNVDINEGGEATFTAPNNGTFISSNLRYEAIDDATCGTNVSPTLGGNTVTLAADNGVWGDPCGGWYKHLVGTLTYSSAQPQFIKDPALLLEVQTSEANLTSAQQAESQALANLSQSDSTYTTSNQAVEQFQEELDAAQTSYDEASATYDEESATYTEIRQEALDNQTSYQTSLKDYSAAQNSFSATQATFTTLSTKISSVKSEYDAAQTNFQQAETTFNNSEATEQSAQTDVEKAQDEVDIAQDELDSIPAYVPPPAPEAPEIPEGDPKDLSTEEVTALVTQAEAVLETAEQGSAQYEQALEALAVAAEADDPEISAELAAIPLLGDAAGAALEVLNNLGNVGADMAPAVREEAEKTVIASVIATGAAVNAVQAAAGAAASAASAAAATSTSTSGSTSGGGGGGASGSSDSKPTRSTRKAK